MKSDDFITLTKDLRDLGGQRVWSLMISLFGDLAQGKGQVIDGPVLTAIMNMLDVRPEATRVALHRLRNDGWITSQKSGRISQHSLTAKGRAESVAASPRIYAQPGRIEEGWQVIMIETPTSHSRQDMRDIGFAALTDRVFLGGVDATAPGDALRLAGDAIPNWLPKELEPDGLRKDYAGLLKTLGDLTAALPHPGQVSPLETAVLRCLIVHNWRRLVLKHPALPPALLAPDWPGLPCHTLVADLLARFPRPVLADIALQPAVA